MKRKDYDQKYDDFSPVSLSSPSAKSRRLDPNLLDLVNYGDQGSCTVSEIVAEPFPEQKFPSNDEKALVLYNPMANTPMFKSPSVSSDLSVVVNPNFAPDLKERLLWLSNSKMDNSLEPISMQASSMAVSDDRLAVVPWVGPSTSKPVEVEEVEMMDIEEEEAPTGSVMSEPAVELQFWQQQSHCMRPELMQSNRTPVTLVDNFGFNNAWFG